MFSKTLYGTTFKDVNFVPLQSATFCVQCELISTNSKPYCLACGSHALLGLSRVLGGSLRNQQTAHLITDMELEQSGARFAAHGARPRRVSTWLIILVCRRWLSAASFASPMPPILCPASGPCS